MTESDRLRAYLDELAAHGEMAEEANEVERDPALQEIAAAITALGCPDLPSAVDTRFQALLTTVRRSDPASRSTLTLSSSLDHWRAALTKQAAVFWSWLTSRGPTARPAVAFALLLVVAAILLAVFFVNNSQRKVARVTAVVGQAEVMTDGDWTPLESGDAVRSGQRIRTDSSGSATVRFFEGTETTITADTDATLTTVSGRLGGALQVTWTQRAGSTEHKVVPLRGRTASYQVETPGGTLQVQGTSFSVAVQPDGQTLVSVAEGQVTMTGSGETVTLQAGQATVAGPDLAPIAPAYQFAGQGELTHMAGTLWTIGNLPVTVISQTVMAGSPAVGDFVSVSGRILPGDLWLADLITVSTPGASGVRFTAPIESMGPSFWQLGTVTVAVTSQTNQIGNLELGTLVQGTSTVLSDGTLVALQIEEIGGPVPTSTATATSTTTVTPMPSDTATATASSVPSTATPSATPLLTPTATFSPTATALPTLTPSTQPPPTPGDGRPIMVNDHDQTRTFTCNGNSVTINGNNNTITLLGSCAVVMIGGNNNWVSIESATSVTNAGNHNTIVGPLSVPVMPSMQPPSPHDHHSQPHNHHSHH